MARTGPSFRVVLAEEKAEWKPFRNALDKQEKKEFDGMWDIPRLYVSACSNSVQLVPLHPIIMSILFHHYRELIQCISGVERMEAKVSNGKKKGINRSGRRKTRRGILAAATTVKTLRILSCSNPYLLSWPLFLLIFFLNVLL
jgi:hypothetical protein